MVYTAIKDNSTRKQLKSTVTHTTSLKRSSVPLVENRAYRKLFSVQQRLLSQAVRILVVCGNPLLSPKKTASTAASPITCRTVRWCHENLACWKTLCPCNMGRRVVKMHAYLKARPRFRIAGLIISHVVQVCAAHQDLAAFVAARSG